jgi:hypothetical protein
MEYPLSKIVYGFLLWRSRQESNTKGSCVSGITAWHAQTEPVSDTFGELEKENRTVARLLWAELAKREEWR